jgi:hypothetical protein
MENNNPQVLHELVELFRLAPFPPVRDIWRLLPTEEKSDLIDLGEQ